MSITIHLKPFDIPLEEYRHTTKKLLDVEIVEGVKLEKIVK